jgi:hypothetical protein
LVLFIKYSKLSDLAFGSNAFCKKKIRQN